MQRCQATDLTEKKALIHVGEAAKQGWDIN